MISTTDIKLCAILEYVSSTRAIFELPLKTVRRRHELYHNKDIEQINALNNAKDIEFVLSISD